MENQRVFYISFIETSRGNIVQIGNVYFQFPYFPSHIECKEDLLKMKKILYPMDSECVVMSISEIPQEDYELMNKREEKRSEIY